MTIAFFGIMAHSASIFVELEAQIVVDYAGRRIASRHCQREFVFTLLHERCIERQFALIPNALTAVTGKHTVTDEARELSRGLVVDGDIDRSDTRAGEGGAECGLALGLGIDHELNGVGSRAARDAGWAESARCRRDCRSIGFGMGYVLEEPVFSEIAFADDVGNVIGEQRAVRGTDAGGVVDVSLEEFRAVAIRDANVPELLPTANRRPSDFA